MAAFFEMSIYLQNTVCKYDTLSSFCYSALKYQNTGNIEKKYYVWIAKVRFQKIPTHGIVVKRMDLIPWGYESRNSVFSMQS